MIRRPPRSTLDRSSAASDVYKRQEEVNKEAIGPNSASMLEVIFYPQIFAGRIQMTAQAAKDLADALQQEHKQTPPVDLSLIHISEPTRPY